ncbi:MAG TPA: hypothetical protein ENK54_06320 [Thiotrichales bacterium]|nr:hypothetical protein [Thiotrichales bacterium]
MLKKAILAFFNAGSRKCDFRLPHVFNDLRSLKTAVHPCTAAQAVEQAPRKPGAEKAVFPFLHLFNGLPLLNVVMPPRILHGQEQGTGPVSINHGHH